VEKAMKDIRKTLDEKVIPMLEYWIDPVRCKKVDHSNLVHAHLIYLFKNYSYEEFDYRSISVLLTSQVYLSINHRFSNKAYDDLADSSDPSKPPPSIQIAQSEIFDIIQGKRYHILQYMKENPDDANAAMEAVVRIATGTGPREIVDSKTKLMKQRKWKSIGHVSLYLSCRSLLVISSQSHTDIHLFPPLLSSLHAMDVLFPIQRMKNSAMVPTASQSKARLLSSGC
jgi:hypothetical protein